MNDVETTPGARLRAARLGAKLSQVRAAAKAGISQARWSEYERDDYRFGLEVLLRMSCALGVEPSVLDPRLAATNPK